MQDVARQQSDAESAMATFPYLRPSIGLLPGTSFKVLKLDGTVQMFYNGNGYFVPLCIYFRDDHPTSPPVCIITPTPEMMIKPNHRHVDAQGVVYLPYLHEWSRKSSIVEMVHAVSAVFTADPFIFKKPKPQGGPPPYATSSTPTDGSHVRTPIYAQQKNPTVTAATPPRHPLPVPPVQQRPAAGQSVQTDGKGKTTFSESELGVGLSKEDAKSAYNDKTKAIEDLDSVLEASFRCPISMEIMEDPVFAADGHTYERSEIERWLQTKNTSPLTNEVLPHKTLVPNHNLRSQIKDYNAAGVRRS